MTQSGLMNLKLPPISALTVHDRRRSSNSTISLTSCRNRSLSEDLELPTPPMSSSPSSKQSPFPEPQETQQPGPLSSSTTNSATTAPSYTTIHPTTVPVSASSSIPSIPFSGPPQFFAPVPPFYHPERPSAQGLVQYPSVAYGQGAVMLASPMHHQYQPMTGHHPFVATQPAVSAPAASSNSAAVVKSNLKTRRGKAHAAKACINCKKAHLSCGNERPCQRCKSSHKQDTCVDVEHRKRGRPRLQTHADRPPLPRESPLRLLKNSRSNDNTREFGTRLPPDRRPSLPVNYSPGNHMSMSHSSNTGSDANGFRRIVLERAQFEPFVAFLNFEFQFLKVSEAFRQLINNGQDMRGLPLRDFIARDHLQAMEQLQVRLRDERNASFPNSLPPIQTAEMLHVEALDTANVERFTQQFNENEGMWVFHVSEGRTEGLSFNISVARSGNMPFIALVVRQGARSNHQSMISPSTPYSPGIQSYESHNMARDLTTSSSLYTRSAPTSPFHTLPQQLSGPLLSIASSGSMATNSTMEHNMTPSSGYFPLHAPRDAYDPSFSRIHGSPIGNSSSSSHRMFPPPPNQLTTPFANLPPSTSASAYASASVSSANAQNPSHRAAPAPLSNIRALPLPAGSISAPVTPNNPEAGFNDMYAHRHSVTSASTSTPGAYSLSTPESTGTRPASADQPDLDDEAEFNSRTTQPKIRRVGIGELIEE